ncbi:hypothetical protein [Deinococcus roseus]|uniref:Uncharacterized protein n=1 Tax=Deinococcus roseus TaxID=392414 RepID=A0ABQ2CW34_9DEIO|nr:hypothetical protein [Deinococcus roseus]GGJ26525.1 hypothetical protein GCM10008938_10890 [Deinococcus roseus]
MKRILLTALAFGSLALAAPTQINLLNTPIQADAEQQGNQVWVSAIPFWQAAGGQFLGIDPSTLSIKVQYQGKVLQLKFSLRNNQPYFLLSDLTDQLKLTVVRQNGAYVLTAQDAVAAPVVLPVSPPEPLPVVTACAAPSWKGGPVSRADLVQDAKDLYDRVDAGEDISGFLKKRFEALGIPVLPLAQSVPQLKQSKMLVPDLQLALMNRAFQQGNLIGVKSYLDLLKQRGVTFKTDLNCALQGLADQNSFSPEETVLAYILLLGQERTLRDGVSSTSVWGDGFLDPLQMALLNVLIGVQNHPLAVAQKPRNHFNLFALLWTDWLTDWVKGMPAGKAQSTLVGGPLQDLLGSSTSWKDLPRDALCSSLTLYGFKLDLSVEKPNLYRKLPDDASRPFLTTVKLKVQFQDDYSKNVLFGIVDVKTLLGDLGCKVPDPGDAKNTSLEWQLDDTLQKHGDLDIKPTHTDDTGSATATYRTKDDKTPRAYRVKRKSDIGRIGVQLTGLLSDLRGIEAAVRSSGKAATADQRITVNYYEPPKLKFLMDSDLRLSGDGGGTRMVVQSEFPLEAYFEGETLKGYRGSGVINVKQLSLDPKKCTVSGTPGQAVVHLVIDDPDSEDLKMLLQVGKPTGGGVAPMMELHCPAPGPVPPIDAWTSPFIGAHEGELGTLLDPNPQAGLLIKHWQLPHTTILGVKSYSGSHPAGKGTITETTTLTLDLLP